MTLQEFVKDQYKGMAENFPWKFQNHDWDEERNRAAFWLRAFVLLIRAEAADLPPETDLGYSDRICRVFDQKCEEFGLPVDTDVEVVSLEEPEP